MSECPFDGDCSCCERAAVEIKRLRAEMAALQDSESLEMITLRTEIDRLRGERDKWVEYVTGDSAELVLKLEAALARAEKAERERDQWVRERAEFDAMRRSMFDE
jgi:hypothetical protein